jgi:hypothetical protein
VRRKFFGVVDFSIDITGRENYCRGYNGSGKRSPARFINSSNELVAFLIGNIFKSVQWSPLRQEPEAPSNNVTSRGIEKNKGKIPSLY